MLKSPVVTVEELLEMKPLVKVARPVEVRVELSVRVLAVREPIVPDCEKRLVELAVSEYRVVVVAFPRIVVPRVALVLKRLVELAVVLKIFVVVAYVTMVFPRVERPVMLRVPAWSPL